MSTAAMASGWPAGAPRQRWWRGALLALLLLGALALWATLALIDLVDPVAMQVSVNGSPLLPELDLAAMPVAYRAMLVVGIAVALMVAALAAVGGAVVALAALVLVVILAMLVVVVPLLVATTVMLVLLSPLWLLGWLLWRATRRPSTTMAA